MKMNEEIKGYFNGQNITDLLQKSKKMAWLAVFFCLDGIFIFMIVAALWALVDKAGGNINILLDPAYRQELYEIFKVFLITVFITICIFYLKRRFRKHHTVLKMLAKEYDNPQRALREIEEQFFSDDTDVLRPMYRQKMGSLWGFYITKDWLIYFDIKSHIIKLDRIVAVYHFYVEVELEYTTISGYNMNIILESGKVKKYTDLELEEIKEIEMVIHKQNPDTYLLGDMTGRYIVASETGQGLNIKNVDTIIQAYQQKRNRR